MKKFLKLMVAVCIINCLAVANYTWGTQAVMPRVAPYQAPSVSWVELKHFADVWREKATINGGFLAFEDTEGHFRALISGKDRGWHTAATKVRLGFKKVQNCKVWDLATVIGWFMQGTEEDKIAAKNLMKRLDSDDWKCVRLKRNRAFKTMCDGLLRYIGAIEEANEEWSDGKIVPTSLEGALHFAHISNNEKLGYVRRLVSEIHWLATSGEVGRSVALYYARLLLGGSRNEVMNVTELTDKRYRDIINKHGKTTAEACVCSDLFGLHSCLHVEAQLQALVYSKIVNFDRNKRLLSWRLPCWSCVWLPVLAESSVFAVRDGLMDEHFFLYPRKIWNEMGRPINQVENNKPAFGLLVCKIPKVMAADNLRH